MNKTSEIPQKEFEEMRDFVFSRGFDPQANVWRTHSGHLGVFMRGEYAGYSLASLVAAVADRLGKRVIYNDE